MPNRLLALSAFLLWCIAAHAAEPFFVKVVDEETGRGVPLVELKLRNQVKYFTDSAGLAAVQEPSLDGQEVFFAVKSHGYEFANETPLGRGISLEVELGAIREIRIRRVMIAERLYRLTGEGIYRDSQMAGWRSPSEHGSFKGKVFGQDTVSSAVYRGRIFWIWGDTKGPMYWNFSVAAATSSLDDDPARAVNYRYFTDDQGRAKQMLPLEGKGLVWIEGLVPMTDSKGEERLVATYKRQDGLKFPEECGLALFDDEEGVFKPWVQWACAEEHKSSHPFLFEGYWYLYPWLRVPNDWEAIQDRTRWEELEVLLPRRTKRPSCVVWNEYRQRWIALTEDFGNVYYSEAERPEGPYGEGVKIIEHDNYNFYNVATHDFFNQEGGRVIYLEGTYTASFSQAKERTPRYDYNQIMYRLSLDDPRLAPAQN